MSSAAANSPHPGSSSSTAVSPTAPLSLQEWLKLLSSRGVNMRVAMTLASKIYNSHNTRQRLSELDAKKLTPLILNKDERKTVVSAIKGIADVAASTATRPRKRNRDSDLLEPLDAGRDEDISLEFNEITDPEILIPVSITTNRAPVKTAWAYAVCRRLGFDVQESLSLAHVYVHISSLKHALMLGNILDARETREAEQELSELPGYKPTKGKERGRGFERIPIGKESSSQPWVGLMRTKVPVIERPDGTWRAIEKGVPIQPSQAYRYITKAFKDYAPHVMGAMKLVAESYEPEELNDHGLAMYNDFKPEVEHWGQRGTVQCVDILDCAKEPPPTITSSNDKMISNIESRGMAGSASPVSPPPDVGPPDSPASKRQKAMTLEEYEALLDEEALSPLADIPEQ